MTRRQEALAESPRFAEMRNAVEIINAKLQGLKHKERVRVLAACTLLFGLDADVIAALRRKP